MDLRSRFNTFFRRQAARCRPENPLRRWAAKMWNSYIARAGGFIDVPIHGEPIRLHSTLRSFTPDYEQEALTAFLGLITEGDFVWDIGANLGIYTILAGRKVGPTGRVVSWEPSPTTFRMLTDHVQANGLAGRCQLLQAAVHDGSTCEVSFLVDAANGASPTNRISGKTVAVSEQSVRVEAASLDTWCMRLGQLPKVIKVDVEGAEVLLFRGASRLMAGDFGPRPSFLVAVHPQMMPDLGCQVEELADILGTRGYRALDLNGQPAQPAKYAEYLFLPSGP
jgi:FkbM family methyltransferase